jgi:hypothetical protein
MRVFKGDGQTFWGTKEGLAKERGWDLVWRNEPKTKRRGLHTDGSGSEALRWISVQVTQPISQVGVTTREISTAIVTRRGALSKVECFSYCFQRSFALQYPGLGCHSLSTKATRLLYQRTFLYSRHSCSKIWLKFHSFPQRRANVCMDASWSVGLVLARARINLTIKCDSSFWMSSDCWAWLLIGST